MSTVWLVCDTSGSMIEGGKRLIMRGLLRQVEQFFRLGYGPKKQLELVLWGNDATSHAWKPSDELPSEIFDCQGSADGEALAKFLASQTDSMFLLLTDGFWSDESWSAIKQWKEGIRPGALRVIKVGADANPKLTGDDVFESEDFLGAMDGWLDK